MDPEMCKLRVGVPVMGADHVDAQPPTEPARARRSKGLVQLVAGVAGFVGGVIWVAVSFASPEGEDLRNRIWTVALLGMCLGVFGLYTTLRAVFGRVARLAMVVMVTGLTLMTFGSFVEYWILFRSPHQGGPGAFARGLAFMTFLLGALLTFAPSPVAGIAMLCRSGIRRFVALSFLLLLPLTIAFALVNKGLASLPIATLSTVGLLHVGGVPLVRATTKTPI